MGGIDGCILLGNELLKLVILRGTPSAKKCLPYVVAVPSRSKKEGVKVVTANLPVSFVNANVVCLL